MKVAVLLQLIFKLPNFRIWSVTLSKLSQHSLQGERRQPQRLHQVVLPITHEKPKQHIRHIVSTQQNAAKAHQAGPQEHQNSQWGGQHQVSQQEPSTQGGTSGMAGRK